VNGNDARAALDSLHLTNRARNLWPQQIDILVQAAQGERAQGRVGLGEISNDAGGRGEADHRGGTGGDEV
jgi:hypothetical protein